MSDIIEQITSIQKEIRETPYHKGTEHHIGKLRARLARLKDKQLDSEVKKGGGGGGGYAVKKQGDATIVLVGPPSAGKSTLINQLTNAQSKVAPYAFTTVSVIPGMMTYKDARIQILDVPGLIEGAEEGKGRGREVLSVVRGADLLVLITDVKRLEAIPRIRAALEKNGIRIDKRPAQVVIEKKNKGGLAIHSNIRQDFSHETVKEIAMEMGVKNGEISIKEKMDLDQLIDIFSKSRVYVPSIEVINKADQLNHSGKPDNRADNEIYISAENGYNLDKFKELIWEKLHFVRVYLIGPDEEPGYINPMIMTGNSRLQDVMEKIGSDFAENKIKAKIWGTGSKFPGQEVSLETTVEEGMQVRFI